MKMLGIAAAAALAFAGSVHAAQTPIGVSGLNQSVTIPVGGSTTNLTATYDGGFAAQKFTFYQVGDNTSAPLTGLPSGTTFVSAADNTTSYALQPAGSKDSILVSATTQTLTVNAPQTYSTLSFLASTGNAMNTTPEVDYVVHYADATTQSGQFHSADWFNSTPVAIGAGGRVDTAGTFDNVSSPGGNPNLYQYDIGAINSASPVTAIDLTLGSGSGNTFVWAVSGTVATPEPASFGVLAAAAIGLLGRRRRNA